ncbi:MAG: PKD domain-containing protein, partial [Thermoplasmata archaeon]|nr:PKD domain-containing protein [Thermoplasmata archaeon]
IYTCNGGLNDTWTYLGGKWTQLSISHAPSPRGWDPIAYDAADSEVLLFGGSAPGYSTLGDTWTYHAGAWTQVFPALRPEPRFDSGSDVAYDPSLGYVVVYGGRDNTTPLYDTWDFHAGTWTLVTTTIYPLNGTSGITYDASEGGILSWGGDVGNSNNNFLNETWIYGPWSPQALSVSLSVSPTTTEAGSPVHFSSTVVGGAGVKSYEYSFGDGARAQLGSSSVNHTYLTVGTYTATVWVNDSYGQTAHSQVGVTVVPAMTVSITVSPNPAVLGTPVSFGSNVLGGVGPYSYSWNFGDGGLGGNLANITHIFTTDGPFTVVVAVEDTTGTVAYGSIQVSILLQATIDANVSIGATPLVVGFTSAVSGGVAPYTYDWNFGDGVSSSLPAPTHTYTRTGTFSVQFRVSDAAGHEISRNWNVTTSAGGGILSVSVAASPQQFYVGNSTNISAAISGGRGGYVTAWANIPSWCTASSLTMLSCRPQVSGSYTFELSVTDASGATQSGSVTIHVLKPGQGTGQPPNGPLAIFGNLTADIIVLLLVAVVVAVLAVAYEARRRAQKRLPPPRIGGAVAATLQGSSVAGAPGGSPGAAATRRNVPQSDAGDTLGDIF